VLAGARACQLLQEGSAGRVGGAWIDRGGHRFRILAPRGTVLATGGFEWDRERLARHFPGPIDFLASPPTNTGDGHRMAEEVGAELAMMDQANIGPALPVAEGDDVQALSVFFHRQQSIVLIDRGGRRFVNEHRPNLGEVLDRRDPATGLPVHLPAWLVGDARFEHHSPVFRRYASRKPGWLVRAGSLDVLATRISVPADTLLATIKRYNDMCEAGEDRDFGRLSLGRLERLPYVAVPFNRSFTSTKGGPKVDAAGRVLRPDTSIVPGLYCAGVAMGNPIGSRGVGAGTTLGPNMTWGYICGLHIARASAAR
jgi:3-oxosteroid 1-dehydrogenase